MIFKLFKIRKTYRDMKEAEVDPKAFVMAEAKESAVLFMLIPYCFALFFLILFFLGGYILGDGSGFFRVLFWIFFIPFLVFSYVFYKVRKALFGVMNSHPSATDHDTVHTTVREVTPESFPEEK